jgi:hypothetical protein
MSSQLILRDRPSLRAVLLPREHGSWSLALEPLALGLVAAPSWPGACFAIGALALFLARRPWQVSRRGDQRARLAFAILGLVAAAAFVEGARHAVGGTIHALVFALVAGAVFAWFDQRKAGREVTAELVGAACFAIFPATIALAAGREGGIATMLSAFALARSTTTILAVRTFLRRRKGESVAPWPAWMAAGIATATFSTLAVVTGNWVPAVWSVVFVLRTGWLLRRNPPRLQARHLGMAEAALGLVAMLTTGVSFAR